MGERRDEGGHGVGRRGRSGAKATGFQLGEGEGYRGQFSKGSLVFCNKRLWTLELDPRDGRGWTRGRGGSRGGPREDPA